MYRLTHFQEDQLANKKNEVAKFLAARWMGASESCCRIFGFDLYDGAPSVMPLAIHLPQQQTVTFPEHGTNAEIKEALNKAANTTLTAFYQYNKQTKLLNQTPLLYKHMPEKCTWNDANKSWKPRKQHFQIGRLHTVHPADSERFHLRLLLTHVPGPTSFEDLRTVNGTTYQTFQEAAVAAGYATDPHEFACILEEAATVLMPGQLRHMFIMMVAQCDIPSNCTLELFEQFLPELIADHTKAQMDVPQAKNKCLMQLQGMLAKINGSTLEKYNLPTPTNPTQEATCTDTSSVVASETNYDKNKLSLFYADNYVQLQKEQKTVADTIMATASPGYTGQRLFFVDGPAGTGKSFTFNTILAGLRSIGKVCIAVAASGIAATLLHNGGTVNNKLKTPLKISAESVCSFTTKSGHCKLFQLADYVFWDESPMNHKYSMECVDRTFRDMMMKLNDNDPKYDPEAANKLFGGKVVIFGGDFRQVLPVIKKGHKAQVIAASLKNSYLWPKIRTIPLHMNMRIRKGLQLCQACMQLPFDKLNTEVCQMCAPILLQQLKFEKFLLDMGDGKLKHTETSSCDIKVPNECLMPHSAGIFEMVNKVFQDLHTKWNDAEYMCSRCVLSPLNTDVDQINEFMMERFPSPLKHVYKSIDSVPEDQAMLFTTDFLNRQESGGMPPHKLLLKTHAPVILLRNLDTSIGLCNGTRLVIVGLHKKFVEARIVTGLPENKGRVVAVPRIKFTTDDMIFDMTRYQFPFKPAFALTINKSQGQTLREIGLYLPNDVFSHGQLYVAFSRVSSLSAIHVLALEKNKKNPSCCPKAKTTTANIVYPEVL